MLTSIFVGGVGMVTDLFQFNLVSYGWGGQDKALVHAPDLGFTLQTGFDSRDTGEHEQKHQHHFPPCVRTSDFGCWGFYVREHSETKWHTTQLMVSWQQIIKNSVRKRALGTHNYSSQRNNWEPNGKLHGSPWNRRHEENIPTQLTKAEREFQLNKNILVMRPQCSWLSPCIFNIVRGTLRTDKYSTCVWQRELFPLNILPDCIFYFLLQLLSLVGFNRYQIQRAVVIQGNIVVA